MTVSTAIHLLGMAGLFPSRAFIPAFAVALAMRFGQSSAFVQGLGLSGPTWFTHDVTLIILGLLAVLELVATKSPEVREALNEFDGYLKAAVAFVVTAGILNASDAKVVEAVRQAGFGDLIVASIMAAVVFLLATIRSMTLGLLIDSDADDDLGVQGLISWVEDLWTVFGFLLLVFYPLIMLFLAGLFFLVIYLVRRYFRHLEEKARVPCASCGQPVYPTAVRCQACKAEQPAPRGVGAFGRSLASPAADRERHRLELVENRRCPECAVHLTERAAKQTCPACGHALMGDQAFAERYLALVDARVPRVLGISLALSFVPVVGAIPAIIYTRLMLVAPFRRYIPTGIGCLVKWSVRLVNLVLILLQVIPIVGALMMPLMAILNYWAYRQVYKTTLG
jgi:predicted RNA-binding Zn-ribbon protein involved in translation (DUF1610 family)